MSAAIQTFAVSTPAQGSKSLIWTGRVISALVVLFLVFDSAMKLIREIHTITASAELGYSPGSIVWIGALLLVCTAIFVIPRTAVLGAVLLTGYLGGAVASNVRVGHPVFECIFPVIFGVLVWAGLFLREPKLRALLPLARITS